MKIKVHMLANNPPEWGFERFVEIPDDVLPGKSRDAVLELVFRYGQNEVQPQRCCSVSVGDVAEYAGQLFMCMAAGWREVSADVFDAYVGRDRRDRRMMVWDLEAVGL